MTEKVMLLFNSCVKKVVRCYDRPDPESVYGMY